MENICVRRILSLFIKLLVILYCFSYKIRLSLKSFTWYTLISYWFLRNKYKSFNQIYKSGNEIWRNGYWKITKRSNRNDEIWNYLYNFQSSPVARNSKVYLFPLVMLQKHRNLLWSKNASPKTHHVIRLRQFRKLYDTAMMLIIEPLKDFLWKRKK